MKLFLLIIVALLTSCASVSKPEQKTIHDFDKAKLDSFFSIIDENDKGMGSVSIFQNGKEVYSNQFGYRDIENRLQIDSETKFWICSISKTFMAVVIMQMVDEGKLSLETKLSEYFPQVKNADKITIKQMLNHSSGIKDFISDPNLASWGLSPINKEDFVRIISEYDPDFEPGEDTLYSNSPFTLLAFIVEQIDEMSYDQILLKRIIEPLNLKNTYTVKGIDPNKNEALSYIKAAEWIKVQSLHPSVVIGCGDVVSTPKDANIFFYNLFNGNLVSKESLKKMMETHSVNISNSKIDIGLGLVRSLFTTKREYGHIGGLDGFRTVSVHFLDDNTTISYFSNAEVTLRKYILVGVHNIYFGLDFDLPIFEESKSIDTNILEQYTGVYENEEYNIKLTVFIENGRLMAKGSGPGQAAFPLEAINETSFIFELANIKIEFIPERDVMNYTQGPVQLIFTKISGIE